MLFCGVIRQRLPLIRRAFHTCIVGSGPSAFYTAKHLLKQKEATSIHMLERLPSPFGLVRHGVAPDHADTKAVINDFREVASNARVSFTGNVHVGKDVSVAELLSAYDAVVLACGAETEKSLGIEGEHLKNYYSARSLVAWYNGHPSAAAKMNVQLSTCGESAVIIGNGNVALDVARILCSDIDDLQHTDITSEAVQQLRASQLRHVYVIGRRGPVQAAFTNKELREVIVKAPFDVRVRHSDFQTINAHSKQEMKERAVNRKMKIFESAVFEDDATDNDVRERDDLPELHLWFHLSPLRFIPDPKDPQTVAGVEFEVTRLEGEAGAQRCVGTGEKVVIPAGLVVGSVGYRSIPLAGVPFDAERGVVPNVCGRVVEDDDTVFQRLYVCGWLKRGATGIIASNIPDAKETVQAIVEDMADKDTDNGKEDKRRHLWKDIVKGERGVELISFEDWSSIDAEERERGRQRDKVREKITQIREMIDVAKAHRDDSSKP